MLLLMRTLLAACAAESPSMAFFDIDENAAWPSYRVRWRDVLADPPAPGPISGEIQ